MRYSLMIYLTKMCKTLLEAVRYMHTTPNTSMRTELQENGRIMLEQIRATLTDYRNALHSALPLDQLSAIENLWGRTDWISTDSNELEKLLLQFKETLPRELSYQVRAVFFAELGEKWDSMESVYTFMREDPRFDPVVVLTPVFRIAMQQDGTEKHEVIYKDYLSPRGIPFVGYNKYSLEEDRPDLAFICQPYESCTLQQFWPENIAKYTRLVYLPYYLPDQIKKGSPVTLCQMPVYHYSWKVICPTEKQCLYYQQHAPYGGSNILLTGMPKLDHLVTLNDRGISLPHGWEIIQEKTTFLWNSWYDLAISSLRYFDYIIGWFHNHTDCALIWRPHPLTETITRLYYPDQYHTYLERIQHIQSMPNAVLDQEPSCDAAFYYSNAQISDYSSFLPQYLLMDKPALWMQNNDGSFTGKEFISSQWMEKTENREGIYTFLEHIRNGIDSNAELRKQIRQSDLPLADGHSGERVCNTLWDMMHREDLYEITD